jgi:hypothetical protein
MSARLAGLKAGLFIALATLGFCGCAHHGGYPVIHAETIPLSELPGVVERAVHAEYPQAQILWAGRFGPKNDVTVYSVEFLASGKRLAASIDAEGKLGSVYEPTNR